MLMHFLILFSFAFPPAPPGLSAKNIELYNWCANNADLKNQYVRAAGTQCHWEKADDYVAAYVSTKRVECAQYFNGVRPSGGFEGRLVCYNPSLDPIPTDPSKKGQYFNCARCDTPSTDYTTLDLQCTVSMYQREIDQCRQLVSVMSYQHKYSESCPVDIEGNVIGPCTPLPSP
jgi:hypothetical protein